jgi:hypothetical protein
MAANSRNTKFDYFVGAVTLIGAGFAFMAFINHQKTSRLKDRLLKIENEIAEIDLERKKNGET